MAEPPLRASLKRPSRLSLNIASNVGFNLLTAVAFVIAVPLFLPYIGVEAYGIVGFYIAVQGLAAVLDLGLNITVTREFAVTQKDDTGSTKMWDLLRTSETLYWATTLLTGGTWLLLSGMISRSLNPEALGAASLVCSVMLMGISLALQFPISLYTNGLYGLQRQTVASGITAGFSVLRNLGVVAVLHYVSARPEVFFAWNAFCSLVQVTILSLTLRACLPRTSQAPRVRLGILLDKWRFVTGIGLITLISAVLGSIDRLVTARIISLENFGYYTLAGTIATGLQWFVQPIFRAIFPRLSQVVLDGDQKVIANLYHQGCQLTSIVVLPVGVTIVLFSREVVTLWQRNEQTTQSTYVLVSILTAAMTVNALLFVPYALQLAHGWTRLQIVALSISIVISLAATVVMVSRFGGIGSATVWLALNCLLLLTTVPISHKKLLPGASPTFFIKDVGLPLVAAVAGAGAARIAFQEADSYFLTLLQVAAAYALSAMCCMWATTASRKWLFDQLPSRTGTSI